ncbi:hypothetical protein BG004_000479 [Podila humilis]|nr:hypothetical protein BG004_000479 [Podila humilis]
MAVTSFSVSPYPLCIMQTACFTATGTFSSAIFAPAKINITGTFLDHPVYSDIHVGCAVGSGLPCPISITTTSLAFCVQMKPNIPSNIVIDLSVQVFNGDGGAILCQKGEHQL